MCVNADGRVSALSPVLLTVLARTQSTILCLHLCVYGAIWPVTSPHAGL